MFLMYSSLPVIQKEYIRIGFIKFNESIGNECKSVAGLRLLREVGDPILRCGCRTANLPHNSEILANRIYLDSTIQCLNRSCPLSQYHNK